MRRLALFGLLAFTWAIHVYHLGAFAAPDVGELESADSKPGRSHFIPRAQAGINQLVLEGAPYARGLAAGRMTHELLLRQEKELTAKLLEFIPSHLGLQVLAVPLMRWYWGIDSYMEPWMKQEMYGVSRSAPIEFDYLADGYSRQIYYHGVHEVGQMMVDRGAVSDADMGCTLAAIPTEGKWLIGRNFDFEGGRVFDTEKIMKWVFPDKGHAFLSVIWAGMVGAVTGVNERGLYISLNAAGTRDRARFGTPSTLIVLKALQFADSAEDAIRMIRETPMFITDIFVVSDRETGKLYRVEKSPARTEVIEQSGPSLVVNHLLSPAWAGDATNLLRRDELTSGEREERGNLLLATVPMNPSARQAEKSILAIMRDKGATSDGKPLHLGNRGAIDALIATHGVIFNEPENLFFVNQGPGVSGRYLGYDLTRSFASHQPVAVRELPADPLVDPAIFLRVAEAARHGHRSAKLSLRHECGPANDELEKARALYPETSDFHAALGEYSALCLKDLPAARAAWSRALALHIPYRAEKHAVEEKLK